MRLRVPMGPGEREASRVGPNGAATRSPPGWAGPARAPRWRASGRGGAAVLCLVVP